MENGTIIRLITFETALPLAGRTFEVYGNQYPLRGRDCEDAELKEFSRQLWSEIAKQNDLSKLNAGTMSLLKKQNEAMPEYCRYDFSKNGAGEWLQD